MSTSLRHKLTETVTRIGDSWLADFSAKQSPHCRLIYCTMEYRTLYPVVATNRDAPYVTGWPPICQNEIQGNLIPGYINFFLGDTKS